MAKALLQLADGRSLEFCRTGPVDPSGWLIFHVGTPSAAALFPHVTAVTDARGIATASYSRAGYGGSTRSESRTVAQEAVNTAVLLTISARRRSSSPVGPAAGRVRSPALRCSPERVRAGVVFAGNSPCRRGGRSGTSGSPSDYRAELQALATGSAEAFRPEYVEAAAEFATLTARVSA